MFLAKKFFIMKSYRMKFHSAPFFLYLQAITSLKKYPLPLRSGKEAKILENIGKFLVFINLKVF